MRELQTALKRRQLYDGAVDGAYGPALRIAIETYEKAQGLPVTGLATQALLKRLHGAAAEKSKARPAKSVSGSTLPRHVGLAAAAACTSRRHSPPRGPRARCSGRRPDACLDLRPF